MILKIDIHIYTDKDASVLSLKKNPKTKQRKDLLTYLRYFFFKIGIYSMQGWTATTRHGITRKRVTKRLKHKGNLFRKNLQLKDVC